MAAILGTYLYGESLSPVRNGLLMNAGPFALVFLGAAIPEELFKFLLVWVLVRRASYFEEPADVMICALMVAAGFSVVENVDHTIIHQFTSNSGPGDVAHLAYIVGLRAIPGHFLSTVHTGAGLGLMKFPKPGTVRPLVTGQAPAVFLHGLWDYIAFSPGCSIWIDMLVLLPLMLFLARQRWHALEAASPWEGSANPTVL